MATDVAKPDTTSENDDFDIEAVIASDDVDAFADFVEQGKWLHEDILFDDDGGLHGYPDLVIVVATRDSWKGGHVLTETVTCHCKVGDIAADVDICGSVSWGWDYRDWFLDGELIKDDSEIGEYLAELPSKFWGPCRVTEDDVRKVVGLNSEFFHNLLRREDVSDEIVEAVCDYAGRSSVGVARRMLRSPHEDEFVDVVKMARKRAGKDCVLNWDQFGQISRTTPPARIYERHLNT